MLTSHLGIYSQTGEVAYVLIRLAQAGDINNLITAAATHCGITRLPVFPLRAQSLPRPNYMFAHTLLFKGAVWSLAAARIKLNLRDINIPAWAYANAYCYNNLWLLVMYSECLFAPSSS